MDNTGLDIIFDKLPAEIRTPLKRCESAYADKITELSLRAGRPVCIYRGSELRYVTNKGFLTDTPATDDLLIADNKAIEDTVLRLCDYSVYAYQNDINSGFITIGGGVRVGLCGRAVYDGDKLINIRDISSLNFRVARDIRGCSAELIGMIDPLSGVLICGEPSSGKTTLIRDMARTLSYRYRVSVLDERSELSAYSRGAPGFDMGLCDIFVGYHKGVGAASAIRSMAPDIIVCDEMGERSDIDILSGALRCGAAFIASVHASSMDDLRTRRATADMIALSAFRYIVFMSGRGNAGMIDKIYEMRGSYA